MAPPVGLLLGHSFVHGLLSHLTAGSSATGATIARKLHVSNILHAFHMHGQRGAQICNDDFLLPHSLITRVKPDFVILDYGTNDLAAGTPPFTVATKLMHLAHQLRSQYHVACVMICSTLNRDCHLSTMTPSQFATAAYELNNYLRHLTQTEPKVNYHLHKGFWDTPVSAWSRDGIHPNGPAGRKRYIKSIRKAIFHALQSFTRQA